ncbi:MAG: formylglycine-generating enzyme family protein [Myxococcales bacterium]|nr:formylglycine-generating enzyme family protein [Myxococcales bacterium]
MSAARKVLLAGLGVVLACGGGRQEPPRPRDDMVLVPAGPFLAGCDPAQGCDPKYGGPLRTEVLAAFEIDRTEVSLGAYRMCWNAGPCKVANDEAMARHDEVNRLRVRRGFEPVSKRAFPAGFVDDQEPPHMPMWGLSHHEARVFCRWLGKRLPTALEWEKAARGTDGRPHPWGWDPPTRKNTSNFHWNHSFPRPVGVQPAGASPYGVLDMMGNVMEYVEDAEPGEDAAWVAGSDWMRSEDLSKGLTVLPRVGRRLSIYARADLEYVGFRCARSVASAPAAAADRR